MESRPAVSRGWIVALAGLGINLTLGVLYSWSIIAKELTTRWGWSTSAASLPYAVACGFFAGVLALGGRAQDRWGPRFVATAGGLLLGAGLLLSSRATPETAWPIVVGFGVLTGSGIALGFVSTFPPAAKWFPPKRRGFITGLVVSGFGIASVYIAPLTQYLLRERGISGTFLTLGIAFLIAATALAQLVRNPPAWYVPPGASLDAESGGRCPTAERDYDWHEMVRTPQFVLLWLMYGLTAFAGIMILGHMAKIADAQLTVDIGFVLVAVLALGNAAGRIVTGALSDRIGTIRTMTLVFALQAVVLGLFGFASTPMTLSIAAFIVGFNYGADLALFPCVVSEYFGQRNQGVNYGLVFTSWGVGGVFGSLVAGAIVDATGSYGPAFALAAVMCAAAAVLTRFTRAPGEGTPARHRMGTAATLRR